MKYLLYFFTFIFIFLILPFVFYYFYIVPNNLSRWDAESIGIIYPKYLIIMVFQLLFITIFNIRFFRQKRAKRV